MCGIAGMILHPGAGGFPIANFAEKMLLGVEERGKHATGFVAVGPGRGKKPKVTYHRKDVTASEFLKTHKVDANAHTVLMHARHWTLGDPKIIENNHPVIHHSCFVTHNGHINNHEELVAEGLNNTETRAGTVDSFAIPVSLEHHGWKEPADIKTALHTLKGGFAIAAIDPIHRPGTVLLAKGSMSPLIVLTTSKGIFWASTESAIKDAWGDIFGTPPKEEAKKPGDPGWYEFKNGDFWVVTTDAQKLFITADKVDVNYPNAHTGNNYNYESYKVHEWTCWPNEKNCIFGDDCGNCSNNDCTCYTDEVFGHPKINKDTSFKAAIVKFAGFQRHCAAKGITEEIVAHENPTLHLVTKQKSGSNLGGDGMPNGPMVERLALLAGDTLTKCFFCHQMKKKSTMKVIDTVKGSPIYKCETCQQIDKDREADGEVEITITPKLKSCIRKFTEDAEEALTVVEAALQETAWEAKCEVDFIRYCVLFQPEPPNNPEYAAFRKLIKQNFEDNLKVVAELRKIEGAKH